MLLVSNILFADKVLSEDAVKPLNLSSQVLSRLERASATVGTTKKHALAPISYTDSTTISLTLHVVLATSVFKRATSISACCCPAK